MSKVTDAQQGWGSQWARGFLWVPAPLSRPPLPSMGARNLDENGLHTTLHPEGGPNLLGRWQANVGSREGNLERKPRVSRM